MKGGHEWTVDMSVPLTPEQARIVAAGRAVKVPVEGRVYCRRCWAPFREDLATAKCGPMTARR